MLSVVVHVVVVLLLLFAPQPGLAAAGPDAESTPRPPDEQPRPREDAPRFVVVEPLRDMPAPTPPPQAEVSDQDRRRQRAADWPSGRRTRCRSRAATRPSASRRRPRSGPMGRGPEPEPAPPADAAPEDRTRAPRGAPTRRRRRAPPPRPRPQGGALGEALRDLQKYVQRESFNNPQGGVNEFGPAIQFDTKGVEFGPWIRRFVAQVKRNWFVPNAAISRCAAASILQFNVHKDGVDHRRATSSAPPRSTRSTARPTTPSLASNPTQPLPPEYPADKAFFTVTFFFNESPTP